MYVEQTHSESLSKRLQRDRHFQEIIMAQHKIYVDLEPGIKKASRLKDVESLLSDLTDFDSSYQFQEMFDSADEQNLLALQSMQINYKKKRLQRKEERLKNCKWNNRKLFITPLKITQLPNPIKMVKFNEFSFPLDSDIFFDLKDKKTREHVAFHMKTDDKRVDSVTYDSNKKIFTAKYQEKVSLGQELFQNAQESYFKEFLTSLGSKKAMDMIETLKKFKASGERKYQMESQYSLTKPTGKEKRIIISSVDKKYQEIIKILPCQHRLVRLTNNSTEELGLIEEEFNMPFLNLMGYTEENKGEIYKDLLNSKIQTSIYTKDVFEIMQSIFDNTNLQLNRNNLDSIAHPGSYTLRDKHGNDVMKFRFKKLQENWIENGCRYKKSYTILDNSGF